MTATVVIVSVGLGGTAASASPTDGSPNPQDKTPADPGVDQPTKKPATAHAPPTAAGSIHLQEVEAPNGAGTDRSCLFFLEAVGFPAGADVSWRINQRPPTGRTLVRQGIIVLGGDGSGQSDNLRLKNGQYRLTMNSLNTKAREENFSTKCANPTTATDKTAGGQPAPPAPFSSPSSPPAATDQPPPDAPPVAISGNSGTQSPPLVLDEQDPNATTDQPAGKASEAQLARTGFPSAAAGGGLGLLLLGGVPYALTRRSMRPDPPS